MFWCFAQRFSKKLQKLAHFVKNDEQSSIWPKLATFRANYHVSLFWLTFQQKGQKVAHFVKKHQKSLIWQSLGTFGAYSPDSAFWSSFDQKVTHFVKEHEKSWILATLTLTLTLTLQLFEQPTKFRRFGELFSKKVQKVAHFMKNNEKSSIWPKLPTFRANYHVSAFFSTFEQEVAKSSSFGEGARKIIDLA